MGYSPWGHKESDTTEETACVYSVHGFVICSHYPNVLRTLNAEKIQQRPKNQVMVTQGVVSENLWKPQIITH